MESVGKPRHDRASNVLEVPDSWEEDGRMEEDGLIPTLVPLLGRRSPPTSDDSEPEPPATVARKVSFADTFGLNLVSVKEFDHWDLPIPLGPEPSESDPRDPEEYFLSCLFEVPSSADELARRLDEQKIELECVELLPGTTCLRGTVRVRNLCFGKMVYIRTTLDRWTTHFDLLADFVPGSSDGVTDRFTFRLTLVPPFESEGARVEFCIRYETELGTFWVNNGGANYVLFCNKRKRAEVKEKQGESRNKKGCLKTNSKNHSTEASPFALPTETPDQPEHSKGVVVGQTLESSVAKEEIQREDNRQNSLVDGNRIQSRRSRRWEARLARIRHHYAQREVEEKRVDVLAKVMGNKNTGASRVLSEISTPPSCVSSPPRTQDRSQTDIQGQMATYGSDSHPEPNKEDTLPLRLDVNDAPVSPQKEDTLPLRLDANDAPVFPQKEDILPLRLDVNDAPVFPQKEDTLPLRLDVNDAPVSPQKEDTLPLRLDVNDAPVSPQKEDTLPLRLDANDAPVFPQKEDTLPLRLDSNDAPVSPQKEDTLPLRLDVNDAPVSPQKEDTLPLRLDVNDAPVSLQKEDTLPLRLDSNDAPVSPQKEDTLPLRLDVNDAPVSPQKADTLPLRLDVNDAPVSPQKADTLPLRLDANDAPVFPQKEDTLPLRLDVNDAPVSPQKEDTLPLRLDVNDAPVSLQKEDTLPLRLDSNDAPVSPQKEDTLPLRLDVNDAPVSPQKADTLPLRLDVNDAPVSPQKADTLPLRLDVNDAPVSLQKEDTLPLRLDSNDAPVSPQKADTLPLRLDANDAPVSPQKADTLPLRLDVNDAPVSPQKEGDGLEGESPEEIGSHLRAGGATQTAELEVIDLGSCLRDSGASLVETGRGPRDVIINGLLSPPGNTGQELPSERDPPRHSHANQEREPAGNDTSCREARPSVGHISHGCVFTFQTFVAPLYQEASRRDVPTLQDEDIVQGGEEDDEEMDDDGEMSCIGAAVAGTLQVCSEGLNELLVNREPNDQDPIDNKNKTATLSGQPEAERILKANIDRTEYDSNHEVGNGEDPLTTKAAELQTDFCEADTQIEDLTAAVEPLYTTVGHESVRGTETYDITFGEIPKEKNKEEEEMEDLLGDRPEAEEEETEETSKTEGEVLITTDEAITEEKEQNNFGEIGEIFNRDNKLDVSMRMECPDEEHTLLGQEKDEKESEEEKKGKDDELMGWDTLSESEKERVSEQDTELQEEKKRKEKDEGISEIKEMSLEGLVCLNEVEKEEKDLFRVTKVHLNGTVKTFSRGRNEEDKDNKEEVLGEMEILSHGGEETTHLVEAEDLTERKFVFREEKYLNKEGKEDTGHILREEGVYFREEQEAFGGEISNDKSEGFFRVKQELLNVAKKEDTGDVLHEKVVHEHERKAMSTKEIHGLNGGNVKENEERVKKEEEESDDVFREKKIHQHERTGSIHVERGEDTNMRQHISMKRNQYLIKEGEEDGGDTLGENKPNFSISQGQETLHGEGGERIDDGQQPVRVEEEEGLFREEKGASEDEEPDTTSTDSVTDDEMEAYVLTVKSLQGFSTAGIHRDQSASPTKRPSISRGPPASLSSIRESLNEEGDAESKTAPPLTAPAHPGESRNSTEVRLLVAEKVENVTEGDSSWWKDSFTFEHVSRVLLYGFLLAVFFLTAYYYDFLACFALYLFSVYWLFCHGDKQRLEGSD